MCLYSQALKTLKNAKSVKIFAPSGAWFKNRTKDRWLKALVEFEGHVEFIAGRGYDELTDDLVLRRFEMLSKGKVDVYELEPNKHFLTGIILFDSCALVGLSSSRPESVRYFETTVPSHLEVLQGLINDSKKIAKKWKKN